MGDCFKFYGLLRKPELYVSNHVARHQNTCVTTLQANKYLVDNKRSMHFVSKLTKLIS